MRRIARSLALSLAATALVALPLTAQSVAGTWDFAFPSPDGSGMVTVPVTFEQNGTEVTGTIDMSAVPEIEGARITEGEFEENVLFFVMQVGAQGQWLAVEVEADVDGDEMVGDAFIAEMGQAIPFTAKRRG